jgi:ankyrin repeat protein
MSGSSTVFISYRREDSAGHAGRLFDRLAGQLGRNHVFRDVDNIGPGENFHDAIRQKIAASDVLFVLIGRRWLTVSDESGRRRLDDTSDLVRREIEMGLERKMRIIPVLLPGAAMPAAKDLPDALAPLATLNAYEVRETHFDQDVLQLLAETKVPGRLSPKRFFRARVVSLGLLAAVCSMAIILSLLWVRPAFFVTPDQARDQLARISLPYDSHTFVQAARQGDAAAVSLFLRAGMKPDAATPGTPSAVQLALDAGHPEIARTLIQAGANVDRALLPVAESGNEDLFQLLLTKKPSHEGLVGALYQAAGRGRIKVVQRLLDGGVSPNDKWGGNVPLHAAAHGGHAEIVRLLLDRGADANAVDTGSGGDGETALQHAVQSDTNALEIVGLLLGAGATVNVQDKTGNTPLMSAVDHPNVALMLLESGADVNLRDKSGGTALMYAAARHVTGMIKVLIDRGANINVQNNHGWTPLMCASGAIDNTDDPQTVQALLDYGANVNKQDADGWTALMYAAREGLDGAARVLIGARANRDKRNRNGQTALQLATINSRKQIISMLIARPR